MVYERGEVLRIQKLVDKAIAVFKLDLNKLTIYTEAGSGYYACTPLIAAKAGANKVIAITQSSRWGSCKEIQESARSLAKQMGVADAISFVSKKRPEDLLQADIVTNLGHVRPIDAMTIGLMKPTAVVPLMWEVWEFRPSELDVKACRKKGIIVAGTNEQLPAVNTFAYLGPVAMKLLLHAGLELVGSIIVVIGSDPFGKYVAEALKRVGCIVKHYDLRSKKKRCWNLSEFKNVDGVVIVEHNHDTLIIGNGGLIDPEELSRINPSCKILHICGNVSTKELSQNGIWYYPKNMAPFGTMTVSTAYVGPKPIIDLHAAGLKVGEIIARLRIQGLSPNIAMNKAKKNPLVQSF